MRLGALIAFVLAAPAAWAQASAPPDGGLDDAPTAGPALSGPTAEPAAPLLQVRGITLEGEFADPRADLEATLAASLAKNAYYVEAGPADLVGTPIGTIPRLLRTLETLGYGATGEALPEPGGVRVRLRVRPLDRVRYIFVTGNWPLRQDEIQRRISFRPGDPLPPAGPARDEAFERERQRIVDLVRNEGYLEANARIDVRRHGAAVAPAQFDVVIDLKMGPGYPIGPLEVRGAQTISAAKIEETIRHRDFRWLYLRPRPFDLNLLRDDIAELTAALRAKDHPAARITTDYDPLRSVDVGARQVRLTVDVHEGPRTSVFFEGARRRDESDLRDELTLSARGAVDDYEVEASADTLHRSYQDRGFLLARVRWRRERVSPGEDRIIFTIDEGPRLEVRTVTFAGNAAFKAEELADVVTVAPYPTWGLGTGGYVTGRQVDLDGERIAAHYRGRGYVRVQVRGQMATSPDLFDAPGALAALAETVDRKAKGVHVRFSIDEGPLFRVGDLRFQNVTGAALPVSEQVLRGNLRLKEGDPYRAALVDEDRRTLLRLFGDAGHPSATVIPDIDLATEADDQRIPLVWRVNPGPATRLGPIFVRGTFHTRRDIILEQIPLHTGEPLTTSALERGKRDLGLLQLFTSATITFPGLDEGQAVVPMLISIVEERHDHWGVPRLGFGISTDQAPPDGSLPFGIYARAGYEHRNLLGRGWQFISDAAYGNTLARANATFADRRLFGTFFRLESGGSYLTQATVRLGDIRVWSGFLGFARQMAPGVDAAFRYNLRTTTRTETLLRPAGPDEEQDTVSIGTTVGSLSLTVEWLRFDNRLVPTRGFKLDGGLELALPDLSFGLGGDTFVKARARSTSVLPLSERWLLRHGVRYEQGFPLGGASVLPKVERYFAGGDTTIRGFDLDRARTEVVRYPIVPGIDGVEYRPLGGSLRLIQNVDLLYRVAGAWHAGVFIDNGVVADSLDRLALAAFRHGAGVAPLVFRLPIGDIQLAWAWPLDPGPGDTKIGRFHVNIGLMF